MSGSFLPFLIVSAKAALPLPAAMFHQELLLMLQLHLTSQHVTCQGISLVLLTVHFKPHSLVMSTETPALRISFIPLIAFPFQFHLYTAFNSTHDRKADLQELGCRFGSLKTKPKGGEKYSPRRHVEATSKGTHLNLQISQSNLLLLFEGSMNGQREGCLYFLFSLMLQHLQAVFLLLRSFFLFLS